MSKTKVMRKHKSEQLCWTCRNATNSGCSWSRSFTPVKGWIATPTEIRFNAGVQRSYRISRCPEYERGTQSVKVTCEGEEKATNERYEDLANAIVLKAARDYRAALRKLKKHPRSKAALNTKKEVKRFFHSNWFKTLTDLDPDVLIKQLNEEVES